MLLEPCYRKYSGIIVCICFGLPYDFNSRLLLCILDGSGITLLYFGVAEHIACKEFHQSDIDTIAELLVSLCIFVVVLECIGETLQTCALARCEETLALAHNRGLSNSHQRREIRTWFDP